MAEAYHWHRSDPAGPPEVARTTTSDSNGGRLAIAARSSISLTYGGGEDRFVAAVQPKVVLTREEWAHLGLCRHVGAAPVVAAVEFTHDTHGFALLAVDW